MGQQHVAEGQQGGILDLFAGCTSRYVSLLTNNRPANTLAVAYCMDVEKSGLRRQHRVKPIAREFDCAYWLFALARNERTAFEEVKFRLLTMKLKYGRMRLARRVVGIGPAFQITD